MVYMRNKKGQFVKGNKAIKYWLGKHRSEETKRKLREANTKNPVNYWKGKKIPAEARRKMSLAKIGMHLGDKHPNWKGGITPENIKIRFSVEYRLWREAVFALDNWTCQKCGERGGMELHAHHVKNFSTNPALRFDISNGVTFCEKDHRIFHKKYGKEDNTKIQLEEFLDD